MVRFLKRSLLDLFRPHVELPTTWSHEDRWDLSKSIFSGARLGPRGRPDHEGSIAVLGDLPPEIFLTAKGLHGFEHVLKSALGSRRLGVYLDRRLEEGLQNQD
jgi:hypothetical protein